MKTTLIALLLLSLALTGCVIEPGGGNRDRGWGGQDHAAFQADHGEHGNWVR